MTSFYDVSVLIFTTVFTCTLTKSQSTSAAGPVVQTPLGPVRGSVFTTPLRNKVRLFYSVPYAEKPTRFVKSEKKKPWTSEMDSTPTPPRCSQMLNIPGSAPKLDPNSSEDCLYLKIMVPDVDGVKNLPVLFWPHGGGFSLGSNRDYDIDIQGDVIVSKGSIIAQPSYRVGPFGFFSTGTSEAPGNYAMWDLVNALQFVKDNIASFGGDPNNVVLIGQGAGGASSSLMTFSPQARGLFSKAIILGSSMFQPMLDTPDRETLKRSCEYLKNVGCQQTTSGQSDRSFSANVLSCLRNKSAEELVVADKYSSLVTMYWHPRMDGPGGVWPEPLNILAMKRTNIPIILGTDNNEQAFDMIVTPSIVAKSKQLDAVSLNSVEKIRSECAKVVPVGIGQIQKQQQCFNHFSAQNASQQSSYMKRAIQIGSTARYHAPVFKDAEFYLQNGNRNVYLYSFDYLRNQDDPWWAAVGSFHNFELAFIENFQFDFYKFAVECRDLEMRAVWSDIFSSFAKFHKDTPLAVTNVTWSPLTPADTSKYLSIDLPPKIKTDFHSSDIAFWNENISV